MSGIYGPETGFTPEGATQWQAPKRVGGMVDGKSGGSSVPENVASLIGEQADVQVSLPGQEPVTIKRVEISAETLGLKPESQRKPGEAIPLTAGVPTRVEAASKPSIR